MKKVKRCNGFLGCRTPKYIEEGIKGICDSNNKEISEVLNYLCRIFIEDEHGVRSNFLKGAKVSLEELNARPINL